MKHRPPTTPRPFSKSAPRLRTRAGVIAAAKKLVEDPEAEVATDLKADSEGALSERMLAAMVVADSMRFNEEIETSLFDSALEKYAPKIRFPDLDDQYADLRTHILAQPEIQQWFARWEPSAIARRQPHRRKPGTKIADQSFAHAKAMFCMAGALNHVPHIRNLNAALTEMPVLQDAFANLGHMASERRAPSMESSNRPAGPLKLYSYSQLREQMKALAETGPMTAWEANAQMFREMRRWYPRAGRVLLLDSTLYPAWAPQKGTVGEPDPHRERQLRKYCPDAGFRMIEHDSAGKRDVSADTPFSAFAHGRTKAVRGYYWLTLVDLETKWPVMAIIQDAKINEHERLRTLFKRLYEVLPDLACDIVVSDPAFEVEETIRMVKTEFGPSLIMRESKVDHSRVLEPGEHRDGTALGFDRHGRVICKHGPCDYKGAESPQRAGLEPGQATPWGQHRTRHQCGSTDPLDSCGRITVRLELNPYRLTGLPNHPFGRPELYAERKVLEMLHSTVIEGTFSRIKQRGKASTGADRARTRAMVEQETYMAVTCLLLNASSLADERQQRGITLSPVPPPADDPDDPESSRYDRVSVAPQPTDSLPIAVGDFPRRADGRPALTVIRGGASP